VLTSRLGGWVQRIAEIANFNRSSERSPENDIYFSIELKCLRTITVTGKSVSRGLSACGGVKLYFSRSHRERLFMVVGTYVLPVDIEDDRFIAAQYPRQSRA
jgi:hypothetical protein